MLVNGIWQGDWQPVQEKDDDGRFIRQTSQFRNWITADGNAGPTGKSGFPAEPGRYRLYVALICPWACRTLMTLQLKGLQDSIEVVVLNPVLSDQGWQFGGYPDTGAAPFAGCQYLHQLYTAADSGYTGRATVPLLWDTKQNVPVNNESADIIQMFNSAFNHLTGNDTNLRPAHLENEIDNLNEWLYNAVNNGVYKSGFATSQLAYEEAYNSLFNALDKIDQLLTAQPFLLGEQLTESDIRLFVTLIRFDAAYHGLFKCNQRTIASYPSLHQYLKRIYDIQGISRTVNIDHIKQGYYSIRALNPNGIVPAGPENLFD
ncbi:glutathione S-transferase family protein [Amphritea sp. HPY]|uniref:glutathione S-transferase family protein n=1 Tax=Amphritea sp. HPY TaxID=3421652 RepID=UPI003D7DB632